MDLEEIKRAYKHCIKFRHQKITSIRLYELDKILAVVEKYIEWMED